MEKYRFEITWIPYAGAAERAKKYGYDPEILERDCLWDFVSIDTCYEHERFKTEKEAQDRAMAILKDNLDALGAVHIHREIYDPHGNGANCPSWDRDEEYAEGGILEMCAGDIAA